jgi:hypothetical protein
MAHIASGDSKTFIGTMPVSFDVNVFWCWDSSHINAFGATLVSVPPMDCVAN